MTRAVEILGDLLWRVALAALALKFIVEGIVVVLRGIL